MGHPGGTGSAEAARAALCLPQGHGQLNPEETDGSSLGPGVGEPVSSREASWRSRAASGLEPVGAPAAALSLVPAPGRNDPEPRGPTTQTRLGSRQAGGPEGPGAQEVLKVEGPHLPAGLPSGAEAVIEGPAVKEKVVVI